MELSFTQKLNLLLVALALSCGVAMASNNAVVNYVPLMGDVSVMGVDDDGNKAANEAAYLRLSDEIDEIQAEYDALYAQFVALAQVKGTGWAASIGNGLGALQSGINAMRGALGNAYAAGTLELDATLADVYEQYGTIMESLNSYKTMFGEASNEAAYTKLSAEIDGIQAEYDALYAQFVALAQVKGSGWAASIGNGLGALQSGINAMKGALGNAYAAGTLTMETTLADIYEQYDTVMESLNSYKTMFAESPNEATYAKLSAEISGIQAEYDALYAQFVALAQVKGTGWAASIGNGLGALQSGINAMKGALGNAYAAGTLTEETTLADIYEQYNTVIESLNSYKTMFAEAANEAAYTKLSAEVDEIQAEYDALYAQFVVLAQEKGSGWAASIGNGLGALQSGINAMKGALGNAYAAGTLTLETTLADVYEQYDAIIESLNSYKTMFIEATPNGAAYTRLSAEIDGIQAEYDALYAQFVALAQVKGSGWAASIGNGLGALQSGINAMKGALGNAYAAGTLTEETTLADIYEQYGTVIESLNSYKTMFAEAVNEAAYTKLSAEVDGIQAEYDALYAQFMALAQVKGTGWAASIGNGLGALQSGINAMKGALGNAYAAGTLTLETTLADIYEQYGTIIESLNSYKAMFEENPNEATYAKLSAEISGIQAEYDALYAQFMALAQVKGTGWAASIGNGLGALQSGINAMKGALGNAYAAGTLTLETTLADVYEQYGAIIESLNSYKTMFAEAANEAAYTKLSAEIDGIQAEYDALYAQFVVLAQEKGTGWAASIGNGLGALQSGINAMKGSLGNAYAAGTLTLETTLADIYEQYGAIIESLNSYKTMFAEAANEAAYTKLGAEIDGIQAEYDALYAQFMALAQVKGTGWAASIGNGLGALQSGINAMKGSLGNAYAAGTLTMETTLADVYEQYGAIIESLNSYKTMFAEAANEAAYTKLSAEVDGIQAEYDALYAQFVALAQVKGTGWAASIGNGLGALQSGINAMKGSLGNAYAAGTLTLETTLADVYEQYDTVIETIAYYKSLFDEIANGIHDVEIVEQFSKGNVYDMNGRRVTTPSKGLFIINGKKVVVK